MFETIVVATDGSESVGRAVSVALDLADRFDAAVHDLSVVDTTEVDSSPQSVQSDLREALSTQADDALQAVTAGTDQPVTTAVREGRPADEVGDYARAVDADMVATGTRGRHGETGFCLVASPSASCAPARCRC
jgi:Universal stress protein UspA and related nucleotide-binding proteins